MKFLKKPKCIEKGKKKIYYQNICINLLNQRFQNNPKAYFIEESINIFYINNWTRRDLNPGSLASEARILPLDYGP